MKRLSEAVASARRSGDPQRLVDVIPYARFIGARLAESDGDLLAELPYSERNIGNPQLPALHGGVIGAFMENAAILHLLWRQETARVPKVVDFSIDYLRPGRPQALYARCDVRRQGKRVANVGVEAWQHDEDGERKLIATARAHFLLVLAEDA